MREFCTSGSVGGRPARGPIRATRARGEARCTSRSSLPDQPGPPSALRRGKPPLKGRAVGEAEKPAHTGPESDGFARWRRSLVGRRLWRTTKLDDMVSRCSLEMLGAGYVDAAPMLAYSDMRKLGTEGPVNRGRVVSGE